MTLIAQEQKWKWWKWAKKSRRDLGGILLEHSNAQIFS